MKGFELFAVLEGRQDAVLVARLEASGEWEAWEAAESALARYERDHPGEVLERAELRGPGSGQAVLGWRFTGRGQV